MAKDIGVVIPVLERNRYSPFGDLVKFGNSTLLEWKIVQLLKVIKKEDIFVATPSEKVENVAKCYGVNIIKRKDESTEFMMDKKIKSIDREHILFTNVTSPFLGPKHYSSIIKKFFSLDENKYDSIITVLKMQEYIIYRNTPLNFNINVFESRGAIKPVYKITNGCSIIKKETCLKYKREFGIQPFLFEVDKFASLEISEIDDDAMLSDLVTHYFRRDLDIIDKDLWK